MKISNQPQTLLAGAALLSMILLAGPAARAVDITQTISQSGGAATGWAAAIWGSPAAVPLPGTNYITPSTFVVRTPDANNIPSTFAGDKLTLNSGSLYMKNGNGAATVNLVLNPGTIQANTFNATGTPALTNGVLAGTVLVQSDSTIRVPNLGALMSIWLQSAVSGSGNLKVDMLTNTLFLSGNNSGYSGNWTNVTGGISTRSGSANVFGSGRIVLQQNTYPLSFNSTNDMLINNVIDGVGFVRKQNSGAVVLTANNTFAGSLSSQNGLLVVTGSGTQGSTLIESNGVLRVASSAALPVGSIVRVNSYEAQTGRLELSNNVTIATGVPVELGTRNNATPALVNISGINVINDQISISTGGSVSRIQADAGTTLTLANIVSAATGTRTVGLQGDGTGTVSSSIDNGAATTFSLIKDGTGTWTLNAANSYNGNTIITNGVLKLGASASLPGTAVIEVSAAGKLDATLPGGLPLGSSQILRGSGAVLGDVITSPGSTIEVGLTNQFAPLALSNSLALAGSDTIRFDVGLVTNDVLNVAGSLTVNGSTTIQIVLPAGVAGVGTFRLINYSGSLLGAGAFSLVTPVSSQTFNLDTSIPGQVNLIVSGVAQNLVWSGDGSGNFWDVATTPNWTGQVFNQADNVTFNDSGSAVPDINVTVPVQPGSMMVSNTAQAYTFIGSAITTANPLVKRGSNVMSLAADGNNFSGPVSIEAGTLAIGNGGSAGSLGTGSVTNNGELLLNKSSQGATISGVISGPGTVRLTGGGAALTLTASNSYTGFTTIEPGCQLSVLNNSALGGTSAGTLVQAGGSVRFTSLGNWAVAEPLEINGYGLGASAGALYANTINNKALWTGPITVGSPSQIRLVNGSVSMTLANTVIGNQQTLQCSPQDTGSLLTFSNTLSLGNDPVLAALTKDGIGTMTLAGSSNLCGSTVINAGTLLVVTTNAPLLGDVTVNAGTLQLGTGLGDGSLPPGAINLAGGTAKLTINSSNTFVLNSQLTGAGSVSLLNFGKLIINSSNTFAGGITTGSGTPTYGGIISLFNSHGLGDGTVAKNVKLVHAALLLQGDLDIPAAISFSTSSGANNIIDPAYGIAQPIRNVSGNNIIEGSITPTGGDGNSEFTVDSGTLTLNGTVSPDITARTVILSGAGNGVLNGALNDNGVNIPALTKQGAGQWTLNNVNDYSGATVIQGGTLVLGAGATIANTPTLQLVSNAVLNVSAVTGGFTLGAAQTLSGNGTVQGSVAATGTVSPGTSVGTLNFVNSLVLSGTTLLELNRTNAQNADLISAATLAFGGTLTVTNLGADLLAGDTFNLFDGVFSGTFAATNLPVLTAPLYWDVSLLASSGVIKVASTAVPQPTITAPTVSGTDFTLQVADSQTGSQYIMEATPVLAPATWTGIQTNTGNGGTLTFTFPITPGSPQQFFRINVQ